MGTENSKLLGKDNSFDSKIDDVPGNTILLTLKSSFKYVGSSAFMPDLSNQRNEDIRNTWSKQHRPPEEYERAVRSIILESFWLPHTRIIRHLNDIKKVIRANPSMESSLMNDFTQILHSAIKKAYPKCSNPSKMRDIFTNCNISEVVVKCYNNSGWRKPFFAYSLRKITETEPQDTIGAI